MRYVSIEDCAAVAFPFIHQNLSEDEPAPAYQEETAGLDDLKKVLDLVQDDRYYPTFSDKAAYVFCGIAGSQYFSNGNKRLGVAVLLLLLIKNRAEALLLRREEYRELLEDRFPAHRWEENLYIGGEFSLFLYNLSVVVGDKPRWSTEDFRVLRERVASVFGRLFRISEVPGNVEQ